MTIPNWISVVLVGAFIPVALMLGLSWQDMAVALVLGFAALVIGIALFAFKVLGGGDAKLMAASVIWLGVSGVLPFLAITALAGGALALLLLSARKWGAVLPVVFPEWMKWLLQPKGDIPYGVAIAVGAVFAFPYSQMLLKLS
ncbi:prepilin peptidase CpaA [Brevundimonas terrae]|nr:prepilin peptidase CpaA [Brevundimonas terrae]